MRASASRIYERPGGGQVEDEIEFGWLFDRQVASFARVESCMPRRPLRPPSGAHVRYNKLGARTEQADCRSRRDGVKITMRRLPPGLRWRPRCRIMYSETVVRRSRIQASGQASEDRRIMATCAEQHKTMPDRVVKAQAL